MPPCAHVCFPRGSVSQVAHLYLWAYYEINLVSGNKNIKVFSMQNTKTDHMWQGTKFFSLNTVYLM